MFKAITGYRIGQSQQHQMLRIYGILKFSTEAVGVIYKFLFANELKF